MPTTTMEDRLKIWLLCYAKASMHDAELTARTLLEINPDNPFREAMVTYLIISYTRPFTKVRAMINGTEVRRYPMEESLVPAGYTELHRDYKSFRDRVFAHTDATDSKGLGIDNAVRIIITDDGIVAAQTRKYSIDTDRLKMTSTLCQHLIDRIEERLTPLFKAHMPDSVRGNGIYQLDLTQDADPWIIKVDTPD